MPVADHSNAFLASGGEMGALMRAHDWSMSPVGPPEGWPQSLRSAVRLMLANKHILSVAWGPELAFLYNDACRPVLGGKHPWALGRPFKEIWSEVWDDVEPLLNAALGGEATWSENLHLILQRNGYPEDCWFTFSYSAVYDESGAVGGLFCAASETTGQVLAERRLKNQAERQRRLFEKAPGFIAIVEGPDHTFEFVNEAYVRLVGQRNFLGRAVRQVLPELDGQGFFELLDRVFVSGERFIAESIPISLQASPESPSRDAVLDFVYEPMRDEAGNVTGIFIEGHDVTPAHLAKIALQERQARQAFISRLSNVLQAEPSAEAMTERALKMLFDEMRLDRCYVGIYWLAEDIGDVPHQVHHDGLPSLPARVRLSDFPKALQVASDRTLVIDDVASMEGLSDTDKANLRGLGMGALIAATLRKGENKPLWAIVGVSNAPRVWTHDEVALVEEVAERTWTATQQAQAEAAVAKSDNRFRLAILNSPITVFEQDRDLRYTWVFNSKLGFDDTLIIGQTDADLMDHALAEQLTALKRRALDAGELIREEIAVEVSGRGVNYFELGVEPRRAADGQIDGVMCMSIDITERRQAQAALRESKAQLRDFNQLLETRIAERTAELDRLWELSPDLLTMVDYEGRLLRVNPSWSRVLGYSEERLLTRPYAEIMHLDEIEAVSTLLDEMKAKERSVLLEHRLLAADGTWRSFVSTLSPEPGGERFYGIGRDVTDDKARAVELEEAHEHLRQSQKLEALGQLTGGVAHDFNNLLTPVIVGLELLQRSHDDARSQKLIGGALQSAERAKTLIQRLLTFARRQSLDPRPIDLKMLLENMRDLLNRSLGPTINVIFGVADDLPAGMIDPNQLELAILNLAINARDAMPNGGVLKINIEVETFANGHGRGLALGQYLRISVTDNGTGMDAETLKHCTEPFFSTKGIGQGTGLGLPMVHGLAAQSAGEFKLTSQLGVGTQALLWIPATERKVVENIPPLPRYAKVGLPATLLLVEDEDLVRISTAEGLRAEGFDVVEASSAAEALNLIASGLQPHLVITDHMMPNMTGAQLAAELRSFAPSLPVLMITGYASTTPGQTDGLEVLAKPFGLTDLAARVAWLLEHAPPATSIWPDAHVVP